MDSGQITVIVIIVVALIFNILICKSNHLKGH